MALNVPISKMVAKRIIFSLFFVLLHYTQTKEVMPIKISNLKLELKNMFALSPAKCLSLNNQKLYSVLSEVASSKGEIIVVESSSKSNCDKACNLKGKALAKNLNTAFKRTLFKLNKEFDFNQDPKKIDVNFILKIQSKFLQNSNKKKFLCKCLMGVVSIHGSKSVQMMLNKIGKELMSKSAEKEIEEINEYLNYIFINRNLANCVEQVGNLADRNKTTKKKSQTLKGKRIMGQKSTRLVNKLNRRSQGGNQSLEGINNSSNASGRRIEVGNVDIEGAANNLPNAHNIAVGNFEIEAANNPTNAPDRYNMENSEARVQILRRMIKAYVRMVAALLLATTSISLANSGNLVYGSVLIILAVYELWMVYCETHNLNNN